MKKNKHNKNYLILKYMGTIISSLSGIFSLNSPTHTELEFKKYHYRFLSEMSLQTSHNDKENLRNDGKNLKKDIKKSIEAYQAEVL